VAPSRLRRRYGDNNLEPRWFHPTRQIVASSSGLKPSWDVGSRACREKSLVGGGGHNISDLEDTIFLLGGAVLGMRMVDVWRVICGVLAATLVVSSCGDLVLNLVSSRLASVVAGGDVRGVLQRGVLFGSVTGKSHAHPCSWGSCSISDNVAPFDPGEKAWAFSEVEVDVHRATTHPDLTKARSWWHASWCFPCTHYDCPSGSSPRSSSSVSLSLLHCLLSAILLRRFSLHKIL
jgi:hypothetical protein